MNSGTTNKRLDLNALKQQISAYLDTNNARYWDLLRNYFKAKISKLELDYFANKYFGDKVHLHNEFILGILHNSYHPAKQSASTATNRRNSAKSRSTSASTSASVSNGLASASGPTASSTPSSISISTSTPVGNVTPGTSVLSIRNHSQDSPLTSVLPLVSVASAEEVSNESGQYLFIQSQEQNHLSSPSVLPSFINSPSYYSTSNSIPPNYSISNSYPHQSPSKGITVASQPFFPTGAPPGLAPSPSPSYNSSTPSTPVVTSNSLSAVGLGSFSLGFDSTQQTLAVPVPTSAAKKQKKPRAPAAEKQTPLVNLSASLGPSVRPNPLATRRPRYYRNKVLLKYILSHCTDSTPMSENISSPQVQPKGKKITKKAKEAAAAAAAAAAASASPNPGPSTLSVGPFGNAFGSPSTAMSSPAQLSAHQSLLQNTPNQGNTSVLDTPGSKKMKLEQTTKPMETTSSINPGLIAAFLRSTANEPDGRKSYELPDINLLKTKMQCHAVESGLQGVSEEACTLMYRALEDRMKDILSRCIHMSRTFTPSDSDTQSLSRPGSTHNTSGNSPHSTPNTSDIPGSVSTLQLNRFLNSSSSPSLASLSSNLQPLRSLSSSSLPSLPSPRQTNGAFGQNLNQLSSNGPNAANSQRNKRSITTRDLYAVTSLSPYIFGEELLVNQERVAILR